MTGARISSPAFSAATGEVTVRLVCPTCRSADGLWAEASFHGWHAVDALTDGKKVRLTAVRRGNPYYEVDRAAPDELEPSEMGCVCDWRGSSSSLLRLGLDGEELSVVHPGQMELT
jgi:hypothetical protein